MATEIKYHNIGSIGELLAGIASHAINKGEGVEGVQGELTEVYNNKLTTGSPYQSIKIKHEGHEVIWKHWPDFKTKQWTPDNPEVLVTLVGQWFQLRQPLVDFYKGELQLKGGRWSIATGQSVPQPASQNWERFEMDGTFTQGEKIQEKMPPLQQSGQIPVKERETINQLELLNYVRMWNIYTQGNFWTPETLQDIVATHVIDKQKNGHTTLHWDDSDLTIGEIAPRKVTALAICQKDLDWCDDEMHDWLFQQGCTIKDKNGEEVGSKKAVPVGQFAGVLAQLQAKIAEKKKAEMPKPTPKPKPDPDFEPVREEEYPF